MKWYAEKKILMKVVTSLRFGLSHFLCFRLALILKYQKYGLWGQWVVCGEKQQRSVFTGGGLWQVPLPQTGLELCVEPMLEAI